MGKGDRRSKKSKIWRHSYGNSRPRPQKKKRAKASEKKKRAKASGKSG